MTNLGLPRPEFSKQFRNRTSLDASTEQCIEVLGSRGDMYELGPSRVDLRSTLESKGDYLVRLSGAYSRMVSHSTSRQRDVQLTLRQDLVSFLL